MDITSEEVELEIKLSSDWWNNPPMCKISLDNIIILQNTPINEPLLVKWKGRLVGGEHTIKLLRHGKNDREIVLDDEKNIAKDQLLKIESIKIDGVDLGYMLYKSSKFIDEHGNINQNLMNMGTNGTWELTFKVPTYIWLLENI